MMRRALGRCHKFHVKVVEYNVKEFPQGTCAQEDPAKAQCVPPSKLVEWSVNHAPRKG